MRIALVTGYVTAGSATHADPRGQAVRVATLASTLASLGHQVTVYARKDSPARPAAEDAGGVRFEYVPAGPAAALSQDRLLGQLGTFSNELARRWAQSPPDVVHAHFWTSGLAALGATRGTGVPVVQTFQTLGTPRKSVMSVDQAVPATQTAEQAVVRSRMERLVGKTVRTVLADSSAELDMLTGLGVPRTAITVVPPGVDTTAFDPAGPAARRGKRRGCWPPRRPRPSTGWRRSSRPWPPCRPPS